MFTLIRLIRVALILVLALLVLSFVIGIGNSTTGRAEKVVLLVLIAVCVYMAARVSTAAIRLQERFARH
ncbi:MAG: hypothetical protein ACXWDI_13600 [Nocardioides sp.]